VGGEESRRKKGKGTELKRRGKEEGKGKFPMERGRSQSSPRRGEGLILERGGGVE
jgi:hypothetical protein